MMDLQHQAIALAESHLLQVGIGLVFSHLGLWLAHSPLSKGKISMNLVAILQAAEEAGHVLELAKSGDEAGVTAELQKPEVAGFLAKELIVAVKVGEGAIEKIEGQVAGEVAPPA